MESIKRKQNSYNLEKLNKDAAKKESKARARQEKLERIPVEELWKKNRKQNLVIESKARFKLEHLRRLK